MDINVPPARRIAAVCQGLGVGLAALVLAATLNASSAQAYVPPFKGNDTGGILAWQSVADLSYREVVALADSHCATYDKVARIRSVHPWYGDYVSFSCEWVPYGPAQRPIRAAY